MKETVLSAQTSGTARKRFEVIIEVINPSLSKKLFFLRRAFFTFSELVRFSRSGSHIAPVDMVYSMYKCQRVLHYRMLRDSVHLL